MSTRDEKTYTARELYERMQARIGKPLAPEPATPTRECKCQCGCDEPATLRDQGVPVCDTCSDYYLDDNDGSVICARLQGRATCRHCDQIINWGRIQTGGPGVSNWIVGRCGCREWRQTDRGGDWQISEHDPARGEEE